MFAALPEQLAPSLRDPNYLMRRGRVNKLRAYFSQVLKPDTAARLLDLGAANAPYKALARDLPVRWFAADLKAHPQTNVLADAQTLPFANECLDVVLCLQVWEYVPQLERAAQEMYRVLKPGAYAIISTPAVFPPFGGARWRILPDGYKTLLKDFSACQVDAECNTAASFFRTMNVYLNILLRGVPLVYPLWRITLCPLFNLIGWWANARFRDIGFAANYIVLAQK